MYTTLNEIEKEYQKRVGDVLNNGYELDAELLLELSVSLFNELKIKNISATFDFLLYQYGTYNWGNEFGNHFSLDITRQFTAPRQDEPYQLSFALIFEPEQFKGVAPYNCWSDSWPDINGFISNIKATEGFKSAAKNVPKTYKLHFGQC